MGYDFPNAQLPQLLPLANSFVVDDVENDLRNLFIDLFEAMLAEQSFDANVLGVAHLGSLDLVRRMVNADGLALLDIEREETATRYLYKAWKSRNKNGRGFHFLETYLQLLFPNQHYVEQMAQSKADPYPTKLSPLKYANDNDFSTSRIRVSITSADVTWNEIDKMDPILRSIVPARLVLYFAKLRAWHRKNYVGPVLLSGAINTIYPAAAFPREFHKSIYNASALTCVSIAEIYPKSLNDDLTGLYADMRQSNEGALFKDAGFGWASGARIDMGNKFIGTASPQWWTPSDVTYKQPTWWSAGVVWFVIWAGVGGTSYNTRINIGGMELWGRRLDGQWVFLNENDSSPTWHTHKDYYNPISAGDTVDYRVEPDGSRSYKLKFNAIHGSTPRIFIDDSSAYDCYYIRMRTKFVLDDPAKPNDMHLAKVLADVGLDAYYDVNTSVANVSPMSYMPLSVVSNFSFVRSSSRVHHAATVRPPNELNNQSGYPDPRTVTRESFESNPPPFLRLQ